jgi:hypothetical protein
MRLFSEAMLKTQFSLPGDLSLQTHATIFSHIKAVQDI